MTAQYRTGIRLEGDASGYRTAAQDAVAATKDLEKAQQAATTSTKGLQEAQAAAALGARRQRAETNQLREATRQLPAQITDVVTSLQAGQNPLTVFIQQGGQIRDAYGSVGAALRGINQVLTPSVLGFTAAGVAVAGTVAALVKGQEEFDNYRKAIALTGNEAGVTTGQLAALARQADAQRFGVTQGQAAGVASQLVGTSDVSRAALNAATESAIALERTLGVEVEKTVAQFAALGRDPLKASVELNKQTNFLTLATYEQIRALVEQNRIAEAGALAQVTYAEVTTKRAGDVDKSLGTLTRAWRGVTSAARESWDAMLNIGREATVEQQLEDVQKQIDKATRLRRLPAFGSSPLADVDGLRQRQAELQEALRLQVRSADRQASDAAAVRAKAKADEEARNRRTRAGRAEREPPPVGFDDLDANDFRQRRLDEMATDLLPESFINRELNQQRERDNRLAEQQRLAEERRRDSAMDAIEQIAQANLYANAEQITDAQERGMRMIALEESEMRRRIGLRTEDVEERRMLEDELATWRANRERALTDELKPEWRRQLEAWSDTTALMKRNFDGMVLTALQSGEDAWVRFATTGKLSITDLVNTMVAQLARGAFQQFLGQLAGAGMFGGGSNPAPAFGAGRTGQVIGAHTGGVIGVDTPTFKRNVSASLFNGAPRFHSGMLASDEYPAILQRGESVLTPGQMRAMGGAKNVQVTLINQSGTQLQASATQRGDSGIEVLLTAMEGFMADRVGAGEGPLTQALQGRYGMRAAV